MVTTTGCLHECKVGRHHYFMNLPPVAALSGDSMTVGEARA